MAEKTLIARILPDEQSPGGLIVASPVVGMADGVPRAGIFLNPLDRLLTMKILNERYTLRMPRDVHGRITETCIPNALTPVAYDDPLVRIDPRALAPGEGDGDVAGVESGAAGEAAAAGQIVGDHMDGPPGVAHVEVHPPGVERTVLDRTVDTHNPDGRALGI